MWISFGVSALSILIAVAAAIFAKRQADESRRATSVQVLLPFFHTWHSPELKEARRKLYQGEVDLESPSIDDEGVLRLLLDQLELLGALVAGGFVDVDVVKAIDAHSPAKMWPLTHRFIESQRRSGSPKYAMSYEALAKQYNTYTARSTA